MADVFERIGIHSGTVFNYHQQRRQTKGYLADLELLQYDILYGEQYVYSGNVPKIGNYMQMGVKDVTLDEIISHLEGTYSLYGENFTKYSRVYVNDERQKVKFLNNTRIELTESQLEDGDIINIKQVGSSNTIFRESKDYIYQNGILKEVPIEEQMEDETEDQTEGETEKTPLSWEDKYPEKAK